MDIYDDYYMQQSGGGFQVPRNPLAQRGHGYFMKLGSSYVLPGLKWLGQKAMGAAGELISNTGINRENIYKAGKELMYDAAGAAAETACKTLTGKIIPQRGTGIKRKREYTLPRVNKRAKVEDFLI